MGSWGKNCKNNCSYGFFGHGCRNQCVCKQQQQCDPVQGCQDLGVLNLDSTTDKNGSDLDIVIISAVATVVLVVILSGIVYFRRSFGKLNRKEKRISTPGRTIEPQIDDQNSIYSDIHESNLVNSGDGTLINYTLPRQWSNNCYKTGFKSMSCKNQIKKTMPAVKRSRSFQSNDYGQMCLGSEDYNHLSFKQQNVGQDTSSEVIYDLCSKEIETVPCTQSLISKEATQNTREKDIEHSYIDVIENDKAVDIEVAQQVEY
ncbi:uncharacterized protein LOC111121446 isoform X2 [Crassostrea virginica]